LGFEDDLLDNVVEADTKYFLDQTTLKVARVQGNQPRDLNVSCRQATDGLAIAVFADGSEYHTWLNWMWVKPKTVASKSDESIVHKRSKSTADAAVCANTAEPGKPKVRKASRGKVSKSKCSKSKRSNHKHNKSTTTGQPSGQAQEPVDTNKGGTCIPKKKATWGGCDRHTKTFNADIEEARKMCTRRAFPDGELIVKVEKRLVKGKLSWTANLRLGVRLGVRQVYSLSEAQAATWGIRTVAAAIHILNKMVVSMNGNQDAASVNFKELALVDFIQ
jgi:hypothetical protein